ncbi:MAG: TrkH family potassium uptake protein [Acidobacteriota bacterium]
MIHWANILKILGYFTLALSGTLGLVTLYAYANSDSGLMPLLQATAVSACAGVLGVLFRQKPHELSHREGILLVALAWMAAGVFGALPFYFSEYFLSFTDSVFESISGFTTTGATVLSDIEAVPESLLFWRSFTHWIGGMGIILLGIAILPLIGAGGMELYRAEFSGARSEKLKPRIAETSLALWRIYASLSVSLYLALRWAGMGPFDAITHTFSTMGTGGFSTRNISIEAFASPLIEFTIVFFMILAGINFTRYYRLLIERRPGSFLRDMEIQGYLAILALATLGVTLERSLNSTLSFFDSFRLALFQVASIMTTTGFSSADYELWSPFSQLLLLALMFIGGCTGSTAGGLKAARIVLLFRVVSREFHRMVERRGVFSIRIDGRAVRENSIQSLLNLVYLAFLVNFAASLALTALGIDMLTAISSVAASMFNVGPALGALGPYDNYGHLPTAAKWILSFCMLAGRLEFYTLVILFTASFWRK